VRRPSSVPAMALYGRYVANDGFTVAEKTPLCSELLGRYGIASLCGPDQILGGTVKATD